MSDLPLFVTTTEEENFKLKQRLEQLKEENTTLSQNLDELRQENDELKAHLELQDNLLTQVVEGADEILEFFNVDCAPDNFKLIAKDYDELVTSIENMGNPEQSLAEHDKQVVAKFVRFINYEFGLDLTSQSLKKATSMFTEKHLEQLKEQ